MKETLCVVTSLVFIGVVTFLTIVNHRQMIMIKQRDSLISTMEQTIKLQEMSRDLLKGYIKVLEESKK
jgi:hypothetical protein